MAIAVTSLLQATQASRKLRAYAYLTASFTDRRNVHDALDCLIPFVAAAIKEDKSEPLAFSKIAYKLEKFGLKVPVYVLEQLRPRLLTAGLIEWSPFEKAFICLDSPLDTLSIKDEAGIDAAFESIETALASYSELHGVTSPPVSATWSDAIIKFLRSDQASEVIKSINVRGALIGDTQQLEAFIVAAFIQRCEKQEIEQFEHIVSVYTGVLIEDFIGNIQSISPPNEFSRLVIYYDTTVILRLLGTSGRLLQSATMEMHRTLQDLGCRTYYFDFIEVEVVNILDAVLAAHDAGFEIYNETAEAVYSGDIKMAEVRDIASTMSTRLAQMNVFPFEYLSSARKSEDIFQIDETSFAAALTSAALQRDRTYKRQNADTDARAVALVLRLRRGLAKRRVSEARHLFVSRNALLQRVSRSFAMKNVEDYDELCTPPVLTVGQITTVAWLSSSKKLEVHKVSRELLAACYSAVRPGAGWADEFARALQRFTTENPEFAEQKADQHLFLQTARAIASEDTLGQVAVLKKTNLATIFEQAAQIASQRDNDLKDQLEKANARIKELEELIRMAAPQEDIKKKEQE